MKLMHKIAFILLIVGGLNWGLDALGYNVVDMLGESLAMMIYIVVGLAALYEAFSHKSYCKNCEVKSSQM